MAKEYKVKALNVGGPGNKIYYLGETVYENNFKEGRAEELVRLGFLEPVHPVNKEEEKEKAKRK